MDLVTDADFARAVESSAPRTADPSAVSSLVETTSSGASLDEQIQPAQPILDIPIEVPADLTGLTDQPLVGIIDSGFHPDVLALDAVVFLGRDRIDDDSNPIMLDAESTDDAEAPETPLIENPAIESTPPEAEPSINPVSEAELAFQATQIVAAPDGFEPLWLGRADGSESWAFSLIEFVDVSLALGFDRAVVSLNVDLTSVLPDMELDSSPDALEPAAEVSEVIIPRFELTSFEQAALNYARQNNVLIVLPAEDIDIPVEDIDIPAENTDISVENTVLPAENTGAASRLGEAAQPFDNVIAVGVPADSTVPETPPNYGEGIDLLASGEPLTPSSPDPALFPLLGASADAGLGEIRLTAIATEPVLSSSPIAPESAALTGSATDDAIANDSITGNATDPPPAPLEATLAAARVTSAIAQIWTVNPDLNYLQVIDTMLNTTTPPTEPMIEPIVEPDEMAESGDEESATLGLLNLDAALEAALLLEGEEYVPAPVPLLPVPLDETSVLVLAVSVAV
ncbi:MAG: hypothetical protein ACFB4J_10130 [Elainellaceae cyanobacterium]